MADSIGETRDRVELKLNGFPLGLASSYQIMVGIYTVPAAFSLTIGVPADALAPVLAGLPPRLPFELLIDGRPQFDGLTDGISCTANATSTSLSVRGRDRMADLVDKYITSERTFRGSTIVELVAAALDDTYGATNWELRFDDEIARRKITGDSKANASANAKAVGKGAKDGTPVPPTSLAAKVLDAKRAYAQLVESTRPGDVTPLNQFIAASLPMLPGMDETKLRAALTGDGNTQILVASKPVGKPPEPTVQAKLGERWYDGAIKPELDRAGLFMFYADGAFHIVAPDPKQQPIARLVRRLNGQGNNVESGSYGNETTRRFSSATFHTRSGGGAEKRTNGAGIVTDAEMVALGYNRPFVQRDDKAKSIAQSEWLALRKLSDGRRQGRKLDYVIAGHTLPGANGTRVVMAADTVVEVVDEVFGIDGTFYVESVEHNRSPATTTTLRLMWPEDCIFGESAGNEGTS